METNTDMFTIDSDDLDVEELEERLELAARFVVKDSSTNEQVLVYFMHDHDTDLWADMTKPGGQS